jgi:ASC-1-like (ASCH) protein
MWEEILRGKIIDVREGSLLSLLSSLDFKKAIPSAKSLEEALAKYKELYGTTEGTFTAYTFTLE